MRDRRPTARADQLRRIPCASDNSPAQEHPRLIHPGAACPGRRLWRLAQPNRARFVYSLSWLRTPASATAEIRSVLEPKAQPPFAARNGSASYRHTRSQSASGRLAVIVTLQPSSLSEPTWANQMKRLPSARRYRHSRTGAPGPILNATAGCRPHDDPIGTTVSLLSVGRPRT